MSSSVYFPFVKWPCLSLVILGMLSLRPAWSGFVYAL